MMNKERAERAVSVINGRTYSTNENFKADATAIVERAIDAAVAERESAIVAALLALPGADVDGDDEAGYYGAGIHDAVRVVRGAK